MTHIRILLDRSGSMDSCREGTVSGFNQYLRDQQALPDDGTGNYERLTLNSRMCRLYA